MQNAHIILSDDSLRGYHCDMFRTAGKFAVVEHSEPLSRPEIAAIAADPSTGLVVADVEGWIDDLRLFRQGDNPRKDIFLGLVLRTRSYEDPDAQYRDALGMMKSLSANLILTEDSANGNGMVITPEEARYGEGAFGGAVRHFVDLLHLRSGLHFTRSTVEDGEVVPWHSEEIPTNLRSVVDHLRRRGAYRAFKGKTVGHFAVKVGNGEFLTSVRHSNFNDLDKPGNGLVRVFAQDDDTVIAHGAKPSVGGQSQRIIFEEHEGFDCIAHAHVPLKPGSAVPVTPQYAYECGSHECGQNTSDHLGEFVLANIYANGEAEAPNGAPQVKAVMLDNHGFNVVFSKNTPASVVIDFIEENFDLDQKTGGPVSA